MLDDQFLKPNEIYNKHLDKLVVDNELVSRSADIFKTLATKLGKTYKAVYIQMQRIHTKNVLLQRNGGIDETQCISSQENTDEPECNLSDVVDEKITQNSVIPEKSNSRSFSKEFENQGIFEVELRSEKHRSKNIMRKAVKTGWTTKLAVFLWKELSLSCKFNFKRAWITADDIIFSNADCECGGKANISCDLRSLRVDVKNVNEDFQHKRKYNFNFKVH